MRNRNAFLIANGHGQKCTVSEGGLRRAIPGDLALAHVVQTTGGAVDAC